MANYAVINVHTGMVENIALWDGETDWPLGEDYVVILLVDGSPVAIGWSYKDGEFVAPPPPDLPPPTPEEILSRNTQQLSMLRNNAAQAMAPVLVSLNLGDATDEETEIARQWQDYYRALGSVDLSVETPVWPTPPSII